MNLGARGLRGVLMRRMDGERHRRGRRAPAFRLFRSHYCDRTVSRRGKRPHRLTVQHALVLVLVLVLERASTTGTADRYRQVSTGDDRIDGHLRMGPQSGADIPVCAGRRGQAGMPAPHCHAPSLRLAGTASPCACAPLRELALHPTPIDPGRPPSTPIEADCRRHRPHHHPACATRSNLRTSALTYAPAKQDICG